MRALHASSFPIYTGHTQAFHSGTAFRYCIQVLRACFLALPDPSALSLCGLVLCQSSNLQLSAAPGIPRIRLVSLRAIGTRTPKLRHSPTKLPMLSVRWRQLATFPSGLTSHCLRCLQKPCTPHPPHPTPPPTHTHTLSLPPSCVQGSKWLDPSLPERLGPFGPCAEGHVAAKPRKGSALLFFSLHPDGRQDYHSMHTGCPVIEGAQGSMLLDCLLGAYSVGVSGWPARCRGGDDMLGCELHAACCACWAVRAWVWAGSMVAVQPLFLSPSCHPPCSAGLPLPSCTSRIPN